MKEQGYVYVVALSVVAFLTFAGASLLIGSAADSNMSAYSRNQSAALHVADAGVDQAGRNLRTPTDLSDDVTMATLPTGTFTVDSPPTALGANRWQVISHGASIRDPDQMRNIEAIFNLVPQSIFQFALFGAQNLAISGNANTDSYDSRLGAYGACLSDCGGANPVYNTDSNGDVGTNATAAGGITLDGSIFIDGRVAVGPGVADPISVVTGYDPTFISGDPKVSAQSDTFPMPDVTVPDGLTCTDYTVSGNTTVTLAPGTYCYENLTVQGGGNLTTDGTGQVTIYITGQFIARGDSTIGYLSDPRKMAVMLSAGTEATIDQGTFGGSTEFYGALYGPKATIDINGNAKVFGSIIANTIALDGDAEIHYDQAMTDLSQLSNVYQSTLISWREI